VTKGFGKEFNQINNLYTKTLTYDNGMEITQHKQFSKQTEIPVFFVHPYSSWQKEPIKITTN
jgi:IS30 family transposase